MKILLDTHLLLWVASQSRRLPPKARKLINDPENDLLFSAASFWEIGIKTGLRKEDFAVDGPLLRRNLLDNGYLELPVTSQHGLAVAKLPPIHKDPFDRILVAQAIVEGVLLLTSDPIIALYPASIEHV